MRREFGLELVPEAFRLRVDCKPVRGVYRSRTHPNLRVIDKENGGKADALNAGINGARFPSSAVSMPTRCCSVTACIDSCCRFSKIRGRWLPAASSVC